MLQSILNGVPAPPLPLRANTNQVAAGYKESERFAPLKWSWTVEVEMWLKTKTRYKVVTVGRRWAAGCPCATRVLPLIACSHGGFEAERLGHDVPAFVFSSLCSAVGATW